MYILGAGLGFPQPQGPKRGQVPPVPDVVLGKNLLEKLNRYLGTNSYLSTNKKSLSIASNSSIQGIGITSIQQFNVQ
jgi:hypothetical protein